MSDGNSVSLWLEQLKAGDPAAARPLWERYFRRLVGLARVKLRDATKRVADEEDVALSAFDSFFRGVEQGRFLELNDRDNLWKLLVTITARKAAHQWRDQQAAKRGGGQVSGESVFKNAGKDGSQPTGFDQVVGPEPTPEFASEVAEETRSLLEKLPDEILRTIALAKMEGYTNDEIAERLTVAPRTIERKLQMIREIWEKGSVDDD